MLEEIDNSNKAYFDRLKPRDYICACGKAYLSYPALFTHIKQKHDGSPPGQITKPGGVNTKRGRPSLKSKQNHAANPLGKKPLKKNEDNQEYSSQNQLSSQNQTIILPKINLLLDQLVFILQELPQENCKKIQLNQIDAFTQMIVVIKRFQGKASQGNQNIVIYGLIEFLQVISQRIEWKKFQQLYVLLILFLQFIIDEENNKSILRTATMDIFCEYINDFIQNHLKAMAEYYQIENMVILREDIAITVFNIVFQWMIVKKYTVYDIRISRSQSKCIYENMQQDSFSNDFP